MCDCYNYTIFAFFRSSVTCWNMSENVYFMTKSVIDHVAIVLL